MVDPVQPGAPTPPKLAVEHLSVRFGAKTALDDVSFEVRDQEIYAIIGPAGGGKTTLLRCLNRTINLQSAAVVSGCVRIDGVDNRTIRPEPDVRRRVGMVAPLPVGLPMSIYDNVAFAPRMSGVRDRTVLDAKVETCLRQAALWDEVKDRLDQLGTRLSGGQQQRLTIARALSHDPEILCLDEFSIAVDPVTTMRIEEVLRELRSDMTIVLVTNLTQQARRLAGRTAFFLQGKLIEVGETEALFEHAADDRTRAYVQGEFG